MSKSKKYSKEFKFKVALEMARNELSLSEVVSKFQVPSSVASRWKKELLERGPMIYDSPRHKEVIKPAELEKLHALVGRLKIENDFLQQASGRLQHY